MVVFVGAVTKQPQSSEIKDGGTRASPVIFRGWGRRGVYIEEYSRLNNSPGSSARFLRNTDPNC
jgi:hypothetical protein